MLFPQSKPFQTQRVAVTEGHELQVYQYGNPTGVPVLVLHGGPGGGMHEFHACNFNPQQWRVIGFDQRGCGRSSYRHDLAANTTADQLQDIETIRRSLGIQQWFVAGGSWGSTLALCYAIHMQTQSAQPLTAPVILGLLLRGVFLARSADTEWLYGAQGVARLFPEFYREFYQSLGFKHAPGHAQELIQRAYQRLQGPHRGVAAETALAWNLWEHRLCTLTAKSGLIDHIRRDDNHVQAARIGAHYFAHQFFLDEFYILSHIDRIAHLPAQVVHGRYDVVCAMDNAYDLVSRWPHAKLKVVQDAGHASIEPGIAHALTAGAEQLLCRARSFML